TFSRLTSPWLDNGCVLFFPLSLRTRTKACAENECPAECSCPPSPPACARGVSWVLDHCGCCKVCAKQFNEDCSATEPCDHIKGLRCHLGAGGDPHRGLCRAEALGLPCEFNGRMYQHGEHFQPNCQHQCTCMNRVVGCMPLCPHQVPLPDWRCSRPHLRQPEGTCCEEWVCEDDNHISEEPDGPGLTTLECSVTCGMGLSSRVTRHNPQCQPIKQIRLCQIRPCEQLPATVKKGKKCQRMTQSQDPVSLTFAGCSTAPLHWLRSCGTCADGRCCMPSRTRTVRMQFHCPNGEDFYQNVMWIHRCKCSDNCQIDRLLSVYNDIHIFTH
uniref:Uncharacterized protein n=1 Tax=Periophthalmus magnuspinnatus TaxID=409849 RepID=A0A3B3ZDL9_9GOBI